MIGSSGSKNLNVGRLDVVEKHISKVPEFVWVLVILCGPKVGESAGLMFKPCQKPAKVLIGSRAYLPQIQDWPRYVYAACFQEDTSVKLTRRSNLKHSSNYPHEACVRRPRKSSRIVAMCYELCSGVRHAATVST